MTARRTANPNAEGARPDAKVGEPPLAPASIAAADWLEEEDPPLSAEPSVGTLGLSMLPLPSSASEFGLDDDDVELQPQSTRNCVSFTGAKVPVPVRSPGHS